MKGNEYTGIYLNPGSDKFQTSLRSKIYVDKSILIGKMNEVLGTEQRYICVSRPRRFGKSMAANMLAAYYGCGEETDHLFQNLAVHNLSSYVEHRNKYDVIMINMQDFLSKAKTVDEMLYLLQKRVIRELQEAYQIEGMDTKHLDWAMQDIYHFIGRPFVVLIDEWDCLFREYKHNSEEQKKYLNFLRDWLKDKAYIGLAYMTGILPIKKYGSHSALNVFSEYAMTNPGELAEFFGFTESEVKDLCDQHDMDFEEIKAWYDGYKLGREKSSDYGNKDVSIYSPKSVVEAMLHHDYQNYWNLTETYEALKIYIQMNFDGLKEAVVAMLAGGSINVNTRKFKNDMVSFSGKDDVLTLLVHLGYLTFDSNMKTVSIPNKEVSEEYMNAIDDIGWDGVMHSIMASRRLLLSLWSLDADAVAEGVDHAHQEVSMLQYNDENALSYTINLAFYAAKEYYTIIREMPSGRGFADICFIPRKLYIDKPAIIIELKWDKSAQGAIHQIKKKQYLAALDEYKGNLLLVGINYNRENKEHECMIEKVQYEAIFNK